MTNPTADTDRGPEPTKGPVHLWRADVWGASVFVRGEAACRHLEAANHRLSTMTVALHRISKMHPAGPGAGDIARAALEECKA